VLKLFGCLLVLFFLEFFLPAEILESSLQVLNIKFFLSSNLIQLVFVAEFTLNQFGFYFLSRKLKVLFEFGLFVQPFVHLFLTDEHNIYEVWVH
jgi:hypothetical protein